MIDPRNSKFSPKIKIDKYQVSSRLRPYNSLESIKSAYVSEYDSIIPGSSPRLSPPTPAVTSLALTFSNISNVNTILGDSSDVSNWNTYFDLPANGNPFTSVSVVGNQVNLYGASNVTLKQQLFDQPDQLGTYLLSVDDALGCVITIEYDVFGDDNYSGCGNLVSVNFPECTSIGQYCFGTCNSLETANIPKLDYIGGNAFQSCLNLISVNFPLAQTRGSGALFAGCSSITSIEVASLLQMNPSDFYGCSSLTNLDISSCTDLGGTVGNDNVFGSGGGSITGQTITITVPSALMTCNSGNPDGDIQWLQANNTVTVVTI